MKSEMGVLFRPGATAVLFDDQGSVTLKVNGCQIEGAPFSYPRVRLDCIYAGSDGSAEPLKTTQKTPQTVGRSMKKRQVIFNPPATIVLWEDGTKTVVHCDERDEYDPKYGLTLCYMKKALGNKSRALNDVLHEVGL